MKYLAGLFLAMGLLGVAAAADAPASDPGYVAGKNYQEVVPAQPTSAGPGQVEVIEFFWYGCPHCFALEPHLEDWLKSKPDYIKFVRIPATLNPNWAVQARAYYTAQVLGIVDKIHEPIFNEIHVNHDFLNTEDKFADFFAKYGVSAQDFHDAFNSFAVDTKMREAQAMQQRYRILGVPTVVINGKYKTDGSMANGWDQMLDIVSWLAAREHDHQSVR